MPPPLENPAAYNRFGSALTIGTVADPVAKALVVSSSRRSCTKSRSRVGKALFPVWKCTHSLSSCGWVSGNTSR